MNDRYFEIPEIEITQELKELPYSNFTKDDWTFYGAKSHKLYQHRYEPGKKIPALTNLYKRWKSKDVVASAQMLKVDPGNSVLPHTDAKRQAAINIPVSNNWDKCYTGLYEAEGWRKLIFLPNFLHTENGIEKKPGGAYPKAKLIKKLQYDNAICLNVSKIHGVVNESNETRYVLSCTINPKYSYEDVKNMYESGLLI